MPSLMLGDKFPDFECHTTAGVFSLHAWAEQKRTLCPKDPWILFFSHPADFSISDFSYHFSARLHDRNLAADERTSEIGSLEPIPYRAFG